MRKPTPESDIDIFSDAPPSIHRSLEDAILAGSISDIVRCTDQRHPLSVRVRALQTLARDYPAHIVTFSAAKDWLPEVSASAKHDSEAPDIWLTPLFEPLVLALKAVLVASGLATKRSRESERMLLELFGQAESTLQSLALEALHAAGTERAIPSLVAARKRTTRIVKTRIDEAIFAIRERSPKGALSLSGDGGMLALSNDDESVEQ